MFSPSPYLAWARRHYPSARYDLAASGIQTVPLAELGIPSDLDDPRGWEHLKSAIARANDVDPAEVTSALGASHGVFLAYAGLLGPGDEALVEDPTYEPVHRVATSMGARVFRFQRRPEDRWDLDLDVIGRALTPATRVVALTNLHNPTGVRVSDGRLREVADLLRRRAPDAHLFVDEVYAPFDDLVDDQGVFRGSARKLAPNVVTCGSLTKCYGLGFQRVGWVLAPPAVTARIGEAVTATVGMLPLAHAHLGAHALARLPALAERARRLQVGKRPLVDAWLAARPHLRWSEPREGLFGLVTVPSLAPDADLLPTIESGIAQHGVVVGAGSFFGVPRAFRLSWSTPKDRLEQGLARLDGALGLSARTP